MNTWGWMVVVVAVAIALVLLAVLVRIRRRRSHLKERFGPEYYRAVSSSGTSGAERDLSDVEKQHQELDLRPLPSATRGRYLEEWRQVEAHFVSDPREAARSAERLVERVLEERGYPVEDDADLRVALVSVDHPDIAERYRHGHAMIENVDGSESTENLRKAIVDFRAVLEDVLQTERAAA